MITTSANQLFAYHSLFPAVASTLASPIPADAVDSNLVREVKGELDILAREPSPLCTQEKMCQ